MHTLCADTELGLEVDGECEVKTSMFQALRECDVGGRAMVVRGVIGSFSFLYLLPISTRNYRDSASLYARRHDRERFCR